jgi:uncharacterized protein YutE (UPF0331/DUF86 family)
MLDRDLILAKVDSIQRYLRRIQDSTKGSPASLSSLDVQDIFVLNLQRSIQLSIDLAAHIVNAKGLGLPKTLKHSFRLLERNAIIDTRLCEKLEKMVGFRNIAVHDYRTIEPNFLRDILQNDVEDIEGFSKIVRGLLAEQSSIL